MPTREKPVLFGDFVVSWLATRAAVWLKGSGYREYEGIARIHLVPELDELPLTEVSAQRIQGYIANKLAAGLAPRTIRNHTIVLRRILEAAVDYGILEENPVDKVVGPRIERSEMPYLTPQQIRQVIENTPPAFQLLVALPALGGLRKGECLAAEWSLLSYDPLTIRITKSMRNGVVTSPKTRSSVSTVPLPETVLPYIEHRRRQAGGHKLVFSKGNDGLTPLSDSTPNRVLARALGKAGLPQIRFHDLRRSFVIGHLLAGTDVRTLAALARCSTTTLLETYAEFVVSQGSDAVRQFDQLIHRHDG